MNAGEIRNHRLSEAALVKAVTLALCCCATLWVSWLYWPGLTGGFLFDDYQTLQSLGDWNGVKNFNTLKLYLESGHAGPTGRPISMLSFLLNATTWPTNPLPFKLTNLVLHIACGIVLFFLCNSISRLATPELKPSHHQAIAFIASVWWLANPLLVSTTLYVVQRMAQLSTLFSLLGIYGYIQGRSQMQNNRRSAYLWITLSVVLGTACATLAKENGALLPVALLLIELLFFSSPKTPRHFQLWTACFLWLPTLLIIGYLAWVGVTAPAGIRPFTIYERLLTEARIVWSYLYQLILPRLDSGQFYGDAIEISHSITSPPSTLISIVALAFTIPLAWKIRRTHALTSFAFLFFITGHLVESTTIPLELYYEHRNYYPALFLALPVVSLGIKHYEKHRYLIAFFAFGILGANSFLTYQRAQLWGNTDLLYQYWAEQSPNSVRAQLSAVGVMVKKGNLREASVKLDQAIARSPESLILKLERLSLPMPPRQNKELLANTIKLAKVSHSDAQLMQALQRITEKYELHNEFRQQYDLKEILAALQENRSFSEVFLAKLMARTYVADGNPELAIKIFQKLPRDESFIEPALMFSATLADKGYFHQALDMATEAYSVFLKADYSDHRKQYYAYEIPRLITTLKHDLAEKTEKPNDK
jgi:hypothetical protein